jgi:hypothetical protein
MVKIIKFDNFLNEKIEMDFEKSETVKNEILSMIEKSVNSNDMKLISTFIDSYIDKDSETIIEGLVNDSDVYDFYIKYTNEVDEVLNDIDFFKKNPNELGIISVYNYLVYATNIAVMSIVKKIKEEI